MTSATPEELVFRLMATPEGRADPYPIYREIRERAPVFRGESLPLWYVSGYDDCRSLLRDNRLGKGEPRGGGLFDGSEAPLIGGDRESPRERSMLFLNPPDHTRLRGLVSRAFTPRRIEEMRPRVAAMVDELLDPIADAGEADLVEHLSYRLPVRVIGEMVGVPSSDHDEMREHIDKLVVTLEPSYTQEQAEAAYASSLVVADYMTDLMEQRRREPADDLMSALIDARDGADQLTDGELVSTVILLYAAGFETTTNLISNGVWLLLSHEDQLARLRADRTLLGPAVEEILRYESPVQLDGREAFEDIEVGGHTIPAGETAITLLGGANRDPAMIDDPERFDITRGEIPLISFASGIHYCLGANLARMEGQVTIGGLLDRFEHIELVDDQPEWKPGLTLRGLARLPVQVKPT